MAKNRTIQQFWINGPRFIVIGMFSYSVIEKIISPSSFYTIVNSLNIHINAPEIFLSLFITIEILMIWLLIFKPADGIIYSAWVFLLFTVLIGILHTIGIRELCGDGDVLMKVLGSAKVLQNMGAALLLYSSWLIRKSNK